MTAIFDHGDFVFRCDGCPAKLASYTSNFEAARNLLRRAKWKPTRRTGSPRDGLGEWEHLCPDCVNGTGSLFSPAKRRPQTHIG